MLNRRHVLIVGSLIAAPTAGFACGALSTLAAADYVSACSGPDDHIRYPELCPPPEVTPSSTTSPVTTTVPSTSPPLTVPPSTVIEWPPYTESVPPSTPNSETVPIPPGSCLDTGNCPTDETAVSENPPCVNCETPSSTPSPPTTPSSAASTPSSEQPSPSSTPTTLPATGADDPGTLALVAGFLSAAGAVALLGTRRRKPGAVE